jgi:hypothetical protein
MDDLSPLNDAFEALRLASTDRFGMESFVTSTVYPKSSFVPERISELRDFLRKWPFDHEISMYTNGMCRCVPRQAPLPLLMDKNDLGADRLAVVSSRKGVRNQGKCFCVSQS